MAGSAIANSTLKRRNGEASSTDRTIGVPADAFAKHNMRLAEALRIADYIVLPGVSSDEGGPTTG